MGGLDKFAMIGGGAALGGLAGLTAMTLKAAEAADELVELSDKTGLTTTQLQQFQYIGEQTGTSLETVTGSLQKMIRGMASARDGTGPAAEAFKTLGISVTDSNGQLRNSQQVFGETLDALGGMANETERDALAMAIFGKSAQELNPLIKAGSAGIAEMSTEAERLGVVMSEDAVGGLGALNDKLAGLKKGLQGRIGEIIGEIAPEINRSLDILTNPQIAQVSTGGPLDPFYNSLVELRDTALEVGPQIGDALKQLAAPETQSGIGVLVAGVKELTSFLEGLGKFSGDIATITSAFRQGGVGAGLGAIGATQFQATEGGLFDRMQQQDVALAGVPTLTDQFNRRLEDQNAAVAAGIPLWTALSSLWAGITVPPIITPGSPTPLETGLVGISAAIEQINSSPINIAGNIGTALDDAERIKSELNWTNLQQSGQRWAIGQGPGDPADYLGYGPQRRKFMQMEQARQQKDEQNNQRRMQEHLQSVQAYQQRFQEQRRQSDPALRQQSQQQQQLQTDGLAKAIASAMQAIPQQPVVVQMDGKVVAELVSGRLGQSARANGRIGGPAPLQ